jgi:Uma2 family endonuclease
MSTAASLMTFAEFEQLPDIEGYKQELVNGEVVTMPPPQLEHSLLRDRIQYFLAARLDQRRVHGDHTGYRIGGGWLEPDVSVSWPDQRRDEKYFIGSPMIAVEILSPGEDWAEKLDLYIADGAKEVWIIDHRKKTMRAFVAEQDKVVLSRVTDAFRSEAAGFTITLADIFGAN